MTPQSRIAQETPREQVYRVRPLMASIQWPARSARVGGINGKSFRIIRILVPCRPTVEQLLQQGRESVPRILACAAVSHDFIGHGRQTHCLIAFSGFSPSDLQICPSSQAKTLNHYTHTQKSPGEYGFTVISHDFMPRCSRCQLPRPRWRTRPARGVGRDRG